MGALSEDDSIVVSKSAEVGGELLESIPVTVRMGKSKYSLQVPLMTPRIKGTLKVRAPKELPPGASGVATATFDYEDGDPSSIEVVFLLDNEPVGAVKVGRGSSVSKAFRVRPGSHRVTARVREYGDIATVSFSVERRPTRFEVVDWSPATVYYPDGGEVAAIYKVDPEPLAIEARAYSSTAKVDSVRVDRENRKIIVNLKPEKLTEKVDLKLDVSITAPDHRVESARTEASLAVSLSDRYVEEWVRRINDMIDQAGKLPIIKWLTMAEELLRECKTKVEKFGISCDPLEFQIKENREKLQRFNETENKIHQLVTEGKIFEALQVALGVLQQCREGARYQGASLCSRLPELAGTILVQADAQVRKLLEKGQYRDADTLARLAVKLCRLRPKGAGQACGNLELVERMLDDLNYLIYNSIEVLVPSYHAERLVPASVYINYGGDYEWKGVYIDFTPSKDYIEGLWRKSTSGPVPEKSLRIDLPPIKRDLVLLVEYLIGSKYEGRIPLEYRICVGDLCREESTIIGVGRVAQKRAQAVVGISPFVNKPVQSLRSYRISPIGLQNVFIEPVHVGKYTCTGVLGGGAFGYTLLCNDEQGSLVAVKVSHAHLRLRGGGRETLAEIIPSSPSRYTEQKMIEHFENEARIVASLNHPNVVKLIEYSADPIPHLVFEFCHYGDMDKIMGQVGAPLDPKTVLEVMIPMGDVIRVGHEQDILHLDIKPSNILVTQEFIPKMSDYNIAKILRSLSTGSKHRITQGIWGTPGFAAPEQVKAGVGRIGEKSDIFGHAATTYYLLTGRYIYGAEKPDDIYQLGEDRGYVPARKFNPAVPAELDNVLEGATRFYPGYRVYANMAAYLNDLIDVFRKHFT